MPTSNMVWTSANTADGGTEEKQRSEDISPLPADAASKQRTNISDE